MSTFKERCLSLRRKGYTLPEIVRLTGKPKTSIYFHIRGIALPQEKLARSRLVSGARIRLYAIARKGKSVREFERITTWEPSSVLLLGHLLFDGEIRRGVCSYNNRSKALVERFAKLVEMIYAYPPSLYRNEDTGVTRIAYFNVELSAHLKERALALLRVIHSLPLDAKREFLRSFFDDEGCMDFSFPKRRKIRGYQKEVKILAIVRRLLGEFGIEAKIVKPNEVVLTGKENLLRFEKEINFSPGVYINGNRSNSRWKIHLEKRALLRMAIESYRT
ncbi:MAG: hypothetical protein KGI41_03975 [Patescibacteria group bacterium]|nr:hypothetical protein [Patescibacteria group bacterium]MDE1966368.1 hypothetical protein [Patescibacteria group bacterium]